jgi:hypothetical protein
MSFIKNQHNFVELTGEEVRALPVKQLVQRMDLLRESANWRRVSSSQETIPFPRVSDIFTISRYNQLPEAAQKKLADAAFRFLFQSDLLFESGAIANAVLYNDSYDNEVSWKSPKFRMRHAVLGQYDIISSRIALECFFDLIHLAHDGRKLKGRGKFGAFKKWILGKDNPYQYFLGHIRQAYSFDRENRQKEVHGASRYVHEVLRMQLPSFDEINLPNSLTNILIDVWQPMLQIMDGKEPAPHRVFSSCPDFPLYFHNRHADPVRFRIYLDSLINEMKESEQ